MQFFFVQKYVKMSEKENGPNDTEREELLQNWNENETFATSEATSRVSDVELLKVEYVRKSGKFSLSKLPRSNNDNYFGPISQKYQKCLSDTAGQTNQLLFVNFCHFIDRELCAHLKWFSRRMKWTRFYKNRKKKFQKYFCNKAVFQFKADAQISHRRCCSCSCSYLVQLTLFICLYITPVLFLLIPKVSF